MDGKTTTLYPPLRVTTRPQWRLAAVRLAAGDVSQVAIGFRPLSLKCGAAESRWVSLE